ncbi:MAG: hypothetical protein JWP06_164 [Candidatus Saccharibacteria bacterium]|nr:hypothetical protein [Candidatus Saccharibacteria bacterium]
MQVLIEAAATLVYVSYVYDFFVFLAILLGGQKGVFLIQLRG